MKSVPLEGLTTDNPRNDSIGDVLVVGGGISGIQASKKNPKPAYR